MNSIQARKNQRLFAIAMVLPILALACSMVVPVEPASISPVQEVPVQVATPVKIALPEVVTDEQTALIQLYQLVNPAVVNVTIYGTEAGDTVALGQGSGFVYDNQGNIVTNSHVVQDATDVEVTFSSGLSREGKVIGIDLDSDLAVVHVENIPAGISPLPLGRMDEVVVGMTAIAIGNPFGLEGTMTRGIISAVGRTIPSLTQFSIPEAIQTDAPINPGNSGGPLLNLQGEVIGLNAQIETGGTSRSNSGVGFAIPVSVINQVVPALVKTGKYDWPWLGVRGGDVTATLVEAMNLPVEQGAYIAEVVDGGPAAEAGMRGATETTRFNGRQVEVGGDVVTAIDGQAVKNFDDLLVYIALNTSPNQSITVTVIRDGATKEFKVTLQSRPASVSE